MKVAHGRGICFPFVTTSCFPGIPHPDGAARYVTHNTHFVAVSGRSAGWIAQSLMTGRKRISHEEQALSVTDGLKAALPSHISI